MTTIKFNAYIALSRQTLVLFSKIQIPFVAALTFFSPALICGTAYAQQLVVKRDTVTLHHIYAVGTNGYRFDFKVGIADSVAYNGNNFPFFGLDCDSLNLSVNASLVLTDYRPIMNSPDISSIDSEFRQRRPVLRNTADHGGLLSHILDCVMENKNFTKVYIKSLRVPCYYTIVTCVKRLDWKYRVCDSLINYNEAIVILRKDFVY